MKKLLLILVLTIFLSGCVALVAGAAGATIANPKGTGQAITNAGEAVRKIGKKPQEKTE
jgi:PBP1b-binding outer membrane lipoprotein LpoB